MSPNSIFDIPDGQRLALAKLEARTDRSGPCWLWTSGRTADGYGRFNIAKTTFYAHRAAFEAFVGPIPNGMFVLHSCDTPACTNPEHLRTGTHQDNMRDRTERGRTAGLKKTHCPQGHPYDEENTHYDARRRRSCRACRRQASRQQRRSKKGVRPTDLPRRFDRSIPVWPVLESRPLVVWTDRAGDTWVPTSRTTYDGERVLECQSPQEPADRGEGDSFRWTYRSVAAWFGPLQERRLGGAA